MVREFSQISSNWRSAESAQLYLNRHKIPVIWDIDTRALVRHIRNVGALRGIVATDGTPADQLVHEAKQLPSMAGQELASRVSTAKSYGWDKGSIELATEREAADLMTEADTEDGDAPHHFANVLDRVIHWFGIARTVRKENPVRVHCEDVVG